MLIDSLSLSLSVLLSVSLCRGLRKAIFLFCLPTTGSVTQEFVPKSRTYAPFPLFDEFESRMEALFCMRQALIGFRQEIFRRDQG